MTTNQYRKTERLAVECENFDRRLNPCNYKDRDEWQEILDSYRSARDISVSTIKFREFHRYLRIMLADFFRFDESYDKLLTEWETEVRQEEEEEIEIAESMGKEMEINE
jgi:hypothetical protein